MLRRSESFIRITSSNNYFTVLEQNVVRFLEIWNVFVKNMILFLGNYNVSRLNVSLASINRWINHLTDRRRGSWPSAEKRNCCLRSVPATNKTPHLVVARAAILFLHGHYLIWASTDRLQKRSRGEILIGGISLGDYYEAIRLPISLNRP